MNDWAAQYGRAQLGLDIRLGTLDAQGFEDGEFDAVTMMDLIEHLPSADEALEEAARIVRPEGALVILTPHAGALVSRLLGRRWPEVLPGEHAVLFSVTGMTAALERHGFVASGWHFIGKEAPVDTLIDDLGQGFPGLADGLHKALQFGGLGRRTIDLDPHTKFCLYARRLPHPAGHIHHRAARVPKDPERLAGVDQAIVDELSRMASAPRLMRSMFETFAGDVEGSVILEVGAGIGTFTERMLEHGAKSILAMEPEPACAQVLRERLGDHPQVDIAVEALPEAPSLADRLTSFDLVVCHNVLEHIADDLGALGVMREALIPGGTLSLLVPANPRLFGPLDDAYGHWRRYTRRDLEDVLQRSGFEIRSIQAQNSAGLVGWWTKNLKPGARIGNSSFRAYEAIMAAWQPVEMRLRPAFGLSLVATATRPQP